MKKLLLVVDDRWQRQTLREGLSQFDEQLTVLTAAHGREAVRILDSEPVDLLVTELILPVMDGYELLCFVLQRFPETEIVVMGEGASGRIEQALTAEGRFHYLRKPVAQIALARLVGEILARPARGRIEGVSLAGFLQLLATEDRTCSLTVKQGARTARIDLRDGEPVYAVCGEVEGKGALFEALSWEQPEIDIDLGGVAAEPRIHESLTSLLLQAADARDRESLGEGPATRLFGHFSEFSDELSGFDPALVRQGLVELVDLPGAVSAAIVRLDDRRILASVGVGSREEMINAARQAAELAASRLRSLESEAFAGAIRQFKLYESDRFHLVRFFRGRPGLAIFFAGRLGAGEVDRASAALSELERRLTEAAAGTGSGLAGS